MKTKLLLLFVIAFFIGGCADGFSVGVVTSRIPGTAISEVEQLYGFTFALHWNFEKGQSYGPQNISNQKSGPGSGTWQGSISSQGTAVRLPNQPRGKGERRSRTGVETEEIEKTGAQIQKAKKGQVGKNKARQSESECVWLWLKEEKKSEAISAKFTV